MVRRPTALLVLVLALGPAGCGDQRQAPAAAPDPVGEALAWLEGERDCGDTARVLEDAALGDLLAMDEEAVQERLTLCLRRALQRADLPLMQACLRGLVRHFEGRGRDGRRILSAEAVQAAVFEGSIEVARRAMEAEPPARGRAKAALATAARLPDGGTDPLRRRGVERWVGMENVRDADLGLADHDGGRIVVWADDVLLGEPARLGILARWAEDGAAGGLRVGVIPQLSGQIRTGRRSRDAPPAEQLASIRDRLRTTRIQEEPMVRAPSWTRDHLGLQRHEGAILVVARGGHIVARRAGSLNDLLTLEGWVQKVASR